MLRHTVEPSSPFVSESFCAFCLCNFIVALLLLLSHGRRTAAVGVYDELNEEVCNEDDEEPEKLEKLKKATVAGDEMEVFTEDVKKNDNVEEDEEDEDELMRKAEEFIQRMVKTWKVEKQIQRPEVPSSK